MSLEQTLENKFPNGRWYKGGREYRVACPFCPGRGKTERLGQRCFSINIEDGITHCFRCGYSGTLHNVFLELFGASGYVFSKEPQVRERGDLRKKLAAIQTDKTIQPVEIVGFQPLYDENGRSLKTTVPQYADKARAYLEGRRFGARRCGRLGVGISVAMRSFVGRIILPCFSPQGKLTYYQGRSFDGSEPKYKNASGNKKYALFNYAAASEYNEAVLVEGFFDIVFANFFSCLGKTLSEEQIELVCKTWDNLTIMLDPDAMENEGVKLYEIFSARMGNIYMAWCPGKDPNSTDPYLLEDALANRNKLNTRADLLKIRLGGSA